MVLGHLGASWEHILGWLSKNSLGSKVLPKISPKSFHTRGLEVSWGVLDTSWGVLGTSWGVLGDVVSFGGVLEASWGILGRLGSILGHRGWILRRLGASWTRLGGVLGVS